MDFIVTLRKILEEELQSARSNVINEYDTYEMGYLSGVESVIESIEKLLNKKGY